MGDETEQDLELGTLEDFLDISSFSRAESLTPSETLARIEVNALSFIEIVFNDEKFLDMLMISRSYSNSETTKKNYRLKWNTQKRTLTYLNSIQPYAKMWTLLNFIHELLSNVKIATQREVYYCLIPHFNNQIEVNKSIQDVIALLKCQRKNLNIIASPKGVFGGLLKLKITNNNNNIKEYIDCSDIQQGILITDQIIDIIDNDNYICNAKYLIIIEKEGVFNRLIEDKIHIIMPSLLICGKGFPDLNTRIFIKKLIEKNSKIITIGLFDYNIGGINIYYTYKYGSINMNLETFNYSLFNLHWIGIHPIHIYNLNISIDYLVPLSSHSISLINSVLNKYNNYNNYNNSIKREYVEEMRKLKEYGYSIEIQCVNRLGYNAIYKWLVNEILKYTINKQ